MNSTILKSMSGTGLAKLTIPQRITVYAITHLKTKCPGCHVHVMAELIATLCAG